MVPATECLLASSRKVACQNQESELRSRYSSIAFFSLINLVMAAQPDAQSRSQSGQLKNKANQFFVWYTGAILQIYKNVLSGDLRN